MKEAELINQLYDIHEEYYRAGINFSWDRGLINLRLQMERIGSVGIDRRKTIDVSYEALKSPNIDVLRLALGDLERAFHAR